MSTPEDYADQIGRLNREFILYDRNVDVVSAWEMIFTASDTALREHTRHFERFPSIVAIDGSEVTPDFTVLLDSGIGLVAEVAEFALRDESVDSLCSQLDRYDSLQQLPAGGGAYAAATHIDVMLLVPVELGTAAVQRILNDRVLNPQHSYAPSVTPIIVQFVLAGERYVFQRRPDVENGNFDHSPLPVGSRLSDDWFDRDDVKVKPSRFREIKATRAFMNDPIPPLYLATFLWSKTFAARAARAGDARPVPISVVPAEVANQLRFEHGTVRANDVTRAMELLERARLAERSLDGWIVYWRELHSGGDDRGLADELARRSVRPPRASARAAARRSGTAAIDSSQETLF